MPRCWRLLATAIFTLLLTSTGHSVAQKRTIKPVEFSRIAQSCFFERVRTQISYVKSKYTEAFVAERLISYLGKPVALLTREAARRFCETDIAPLYVKAHKEALADIRKRKSEMPDLAKLSESIELNDKFLQVTANLFINHTVSGHTDLTRRALYALPAELQFEQHARNLIVAASQTPDLYRWEDERYHAHTCIHPDTHTRKCHPDRSEVADRERAIRDSQTVFIGLIGEIMSQILRRIRERAYGRALFWMGVGCHALQDLVYHRGITLRQHAGLSYAVTDSDPDVPKGSLKAERERDAALYCKSFMETVLRRSNADKRYLQMWMPSRGHDLRELAKQEFGSDTDMNTFSLLNYWWLSRAYANGRRPMSELVPGKNGLIEWDVDQVMSAVRQRIEAQG